MQRLVLAIILSYLMIVVDCAGAAPDKPEIFVQTGHSGTVNSVIFSPDGKHIASGSADKTVKLWDLSTGREVATFKTKTEVSAVAFNPDGRRLASCGGANNFITLWDVEKRQKSLDIRMAGDHNYVHDVVFSPDGSIIAAVSYNIQLFDSKTGRNIKIIQADTSSLGSISFSPNGKYLVTGSSSNEFNKKSNPVARLWDLHSGKELIRFDGHPPGNIQVKLSPDGQQIASIGRDKNIFVWDIKKRKKVRTLIGHTYDYGSIAFSPDSRHIISADFHAMTLWDLSTGSIKLALKDDQITATSIAFSPDGTFVAVSAGDAISLWDVSKGTKIRTFGGDVESLSPAYFSADQQKIMIRVPGGVRVFNRNLGMRDSSQAMVESWNYDNRFFLDGNGENSRIVDTQTGREIINIPSSVFLEIMKAGMPNTFSADGHYALLSDQSMDNLKIFDIRNNAPVSTLEGSSPNYKISRNAAFSPDSRFLVGWPEGSFVAWNTRTGQQTVKTKLKGLVFSAVFTSDGTQLVLGGAEGRIDLLETATGKTIRTFAGHLNSVGTVALSNDGKYLLSGDWDGKIKLWDFQTGRELKTFSGHTNWVLSAILSSDNTKIVSSSNDGTTRLWDIASGKEIAKFINFNDGEWISITPEGYYNASPGGDKHINVRVSKNVYGIESYREAFFRPDFVKLALTGGTLKGYRTLADVRQPPTVSIVQTASSSSTEEFKLTLRLEEQGGGIGDVRLFLNDTAILLDSSRSLKAVRKDDSAALYISYTIKLSPGSNVIRAIAFNADNTMQSNAAMHQVQANVANIRKPTLHALVIGIQEFRNPKLQLKYAVADALLFADTLRKGSADLFDQISVTSLTTRDVTTRENITRTLEKLRSINPDDLFILYIASHGTVDDGEYFLITSNVSALSSHRLKTDALSQVQLKELVANIPSTKKLIILDTCNAAALGDAMQVAMLTRGMSEETAIKVLSRAVGSTILSASTSVQEALEGYQGHGLFTWALVQGLLGKADKGRTGFVRTTDLATYVEDEVPAISERVFKRVQQPSASMNGQSFPVSRVR